ncbi:MAG: nucleotidyltransferase domain-containing protein [Nanoarchaeota archaeon]
MKTSRMANATRIAAKLSRLKTVKAIILFGSVARRQERPLSDIDLCVITDNQASDEVKRRIAGYSSPGVDIVLFWDIPISMRYTVLKEGKELYSRTKTTMHETSVRTMDEYLDFKHILDRIVARVAST